MTRLGICLALFFSLPTLSFLQSNALPERNTLPIRFDTTGPKVQDTNGIQQQEEAPIAHSSHRNVQRFTPQDRADTAPLNRAIDPSYEKEEQLAATGTRKQNKRCCAECTCKVCHCGENGHHCCKQCPCGEDDCCGGCCNDECDCCNICCDCRDPCSDCCCCECCGCCWCGCCDRDDWDLTAEGEPCCYNPDHPTWHYWPNFTPERWYYVTHHTHHFIKNLRGCGRH